MAFNPSEHLMKIGYKDKAKDYLEVKWRLVWFRELCPEGTIETEMVMLDLDRLTQDEQSVWNNDKRKMEKVVSEANGFVIFKAIVKDGKGGIAVGTKSEKAAAFPDYIEKCESGAVGRALAMLGYGTQFTADELREGHRIVDSPVDRSDTKGNTSSTNDAPLLSEQQLASLRKLSAALGKSEPENLAALSHADAQQAIQALTVEYRARKAQSVGATAPVPTPTKNVPPASAQSKPLLEMIAHAKQRVIALDMIWADVVRDALGESIADSALTVQQVAKVNGIITQYEKKVA